MSLVGKQVKHKHTEWGDGVVVAVDTHHDRFRLLVQRKDGDLVHVWAEDVRVLG